MLRDDWSFVQIGSRVELYVTRADEITGLLAPDGESQNITEIL